MSPPDPATGDAAARDVTFLVVDDERPARRKLRRLLSSAPGVSRVFEAPSGPLDHGDARVHLDRGDVRRLSRRYRGRIEP